MDTIDFRSDTVTWPTPEMREAMAAARVGDDVYGEDPTVNKLQALAAEMVGKEDGLFVASGTMGNLTALLAHCGRGDEVIIGEDAHSYVHEAGGMATLGGIMPHPLSTDEIGRMAFDDIAGAVRPDDAHYPRSRLIALENSYGDRNGYPLSPDYFAGVADVAAEHGLSIHLDGARLFNAAVALNVSPAAITEHVDSVTFCLSKGLSAPVGSVLCGSTAFIDEARRARKALGGGMRQAGILAAAGIVSLQNMVERLAQDHENARLLAQGLDQIPGIAVDAPDVRTNIVFFHLEPHVSYTSQEVVEHLKNKANVLIGARGARGFRAVTHYWVGPEEVNVLLSALDDLLA